jgi:hypothetical protein
MSTVDHEIKGESSPIQQAEHSQSIKFHDNIQWILAEFPLNETEANITTILEVIAVAISLHSLQGIVLFLNNTKSDKMHPMETMVRHFSDLSE